MLPQPGSCYVRRGVGQNGLRDNPALRPQGASAFDPAYFQQCCGPTASPSSASSPPSASACCVSSWSNRWRGHAAAATLKSRVHRFEGEAAHRLYLDVTSAAVTAGPAPTDEQLRPITTPTRWRFRAPEYRKITLLALTPATLAQWVQVPMLTCSRRLCRNRRPCSARPSSGKCSRWVFPTEPTPPRLWKS